MKSRWLSCGVLLVGALASSLAFAAPGKEADLPDTVVQKGDKKTKCEVVKEGPKELTYKDSHDKTHTMTWDSIVRIEYKDFPSELSGAEAAIERRDYFKAVTAAEEAVKACSDGRFKDLLLARAYVAKAKALRGTSAFKEAADVAAKGVEAAAGSRWAVRAHVERVCALAALQSDDCAKAGEDAEKACDDYPNEVARDLRAEIVLAEGAYFEKKGDTTKAKEKYATAKDSPEYIDRAKLGLARIKILEKDLVGAEEAFNDIAKSTQDADALAGAQLGLGDTALAKAKRSNPLSGDELRGCLELYLRGAVLAQPSGGSASDNHEKTLFGAAECCKLIASTISVPSDKKDKNYEKQASSRKFFVDYARKLYEELVRTYPSASDVEKYKQEIADLRAKSVALSPAAAPEGK